MAVGQGRQRDKEQKEGRARIIGQTSIWALGQADTLAETWADRKTNKQASRHADMQPCRLTANQAGN